MADKESIATQAVQDALVFQEEMKDLIREQFAKSIGYEEVGIRALRRLIRQAKDGDEEAMQEIAQLAMGNQHQEGEPVPCPVCREILEVIHAKPE